jgi:hypothetical protein
MLSVIMPSVVMINVVAPPDVNAKKDEIFECLLAFISMSNIKRFLRSICMSVFIAKNATVLSATAGTLLALAPWAAQ